MKTKLPSIGKHWQATQTKIAKLTGKTGKKIETEKTCSQLTSIDKSSSHPSDATISFEDLSSTTDPGSSALAACCGEVSSCPLVLICGSSSKCCLHLPFPFGATIYDGEGTVDRDHLIGQNSYCHFPFTSSIHLVNGPGAARWLLILLIW